MSLAQVGAYIKLLIFQWREGSIPSDPTSLRRLLGLRGFSFNRLWEGPLAGCFVPHPDLPDRLVQPRMYQDQLRRASVSAIRAREGAKGAKARWAGAQCCDEKEHSAVTKSVSLLSPKPLETKGRAMANGWQSDGSASASAYASNTAVSEIQRSNRARARSKTGTESLPLDLHVGIPRDLSSLPLAVKPIHGWSKGNGGHSSVATKLIEKLKRDGFDAGQWWGKCREPEEAKLASLILLSVKYDKGEEVKSPYGYLSKTVKEKRANLAAAKSEAETNRLKKA